MKSKNFYQPLIDEIKEKGYPHNFKKKHNLTKQSLYYHLLKLVNNKIIARIDTGFYKVVDDKSVKKINGGYPLSTAKIGKKKKKCRGHAFIFTLKIPKIKNWVDRGVYLDKKNISWKWVHQNKAHSIQLVNPVTKIKHRVWLMRPSIMIYWKQSEFKEVPVDSVLAENAFRARGEALHQFLLMVERLERLLNIPSPGFRVKGLYRFKVSKQHHARMYSWFAEVMGKRFGSVRIHGVDGLWFLIDKSIPGEGPEAEFVDSVKSPTQFNQFEDAMNDWEQHKFITHSEVLSLVKANADNQAVFNRNLELHYNVLEDIRRAVRVALGDVGGSVVRKPPSKVDVDAEIKRIFKDVR